jgi:hypothetical protein
MMSRMKDDKTIQEAAQIRDEYAKSAKMAQDNYDQIIQKVESHQSQSANVFSLQMVLN